MAINLLPQDISKKNKQQNRGKSVSFVTYFIFGIAGIVIIVGGLLVFFAQRSINQLTSEQQTLLTEAEQYRQQENQLVIVKDRVETINGVMSQRVLENVTDLHSLLYASMPPGVEFTQQVISDLENVYTFQSNSAVSLNSFIDSVKNNPEFSEINIKQLTYSPSFGYQVDLQVR